MKSFWNSRYAETEYAYGTAPNEFFKHFLEKQPNVGDLLLPADGEGRNAVYAATKGWNVTAFDYSETAREKALQLAALNNVALNYHLDSIEDFNFPNDAFDLVGLFFVHLPTPLRLILHQKTVRTLRKGGKVVLQAFDPAQLNYQSGGPRNAEMLITAQQLLKEFNGLTFSMLEHQTIELNEGLYHVGKASVVQMIAEKPF